MADEQTPQSDLVDDAIRQAERQLEEKLEALRMSALGEPTPQADAPADDVAVLRPTGGGTRMSEAGYDDLDAGVDAPDVAWREAGGEDLTFAPSGSDSVTLTGSELYVPDAEPSFDELPHTLQPHDEPAEQANPAHTTLSASVTGLTPVWDELEMDDEDGAFEPPAHTPTPPRPARRRPPAPAPASAPPVTRSQDWDHPEPVHASWTSASVHPATPAEPLAIVNTPSDDERQFWAQTRTALRMLQQLTGDLPAQVSGEVRGDVERALHDGLGTTHTALQSMHQQLQQGLPRLQERLEVAMEQAVVAPVNGIRQLRDELPEIIERTTRESQDGIAEEIGRSAGAVHAAVQQDVAQLEQSIATNVTRMAQGTTEAVTRVERDVQVLGEGMMRFEHSMHGEFARVEGELRASIERAERSLHAELMTPAETIRKIDEELPAQLGRIEHTVLDQVQASQHELTSVITTLVDANRASLDRIAALASALDEERARRSEDVEVIVDTVTRGWEGLGSAIKALYEQGDETARRVGGVEQRLAQIRDLEGAVEQTMDALQAHVRELSPAPIVVTVSHPDAEVTNTSRTGWLPKTTD